MRTWKRARHIFVVLVIDANDDEGGGGGASLSGYERKWKELKIW